MSNQEFNVQLRMRLPNRLYNFATLAGCHLVQLYRMFAFFGQSSLSSSLQYCTILCPRAPKLCNSFKHFFQTSDKSWLWVTAVFIKTWKLIFDFMISQRSMRPPNQETNKYKQLPSTMWILDHWWSAFCLHHVSLNDSKSLVMEYLRCSTYFQSKKFGVYPLWSLKFGLVNLNTCCPYLAICQQGFFHFSYCIQWLSIVCSILYAHIYLVD